MINRNSDSTFQLGHCQNYQLWTELRLSTILKAELGESTFVLMRCSDASSE